MDWAKTPKAMYRMIPFTRLFWKRQTHRNKTRSVVGLGEEVGGGADNRHRGICEVTGAFCILSGSGHAACAFVKIHRTSRYTVHFNVREVYLPQKREAHISGSHPTDFCCCQGCPPSKPPSARSQPITRHFLTLPPL